MLLLIDNYDSFTFNLAHTLKELNTPTTVLRNDQVSIATIKKLAPEKIIVSPGPGRPETAGTLLEVIKHLAGNIPLLGVCLGHQAIAQAFGAKIIHAPTIMHGKTSAIHHAQQGLFNTLENPFTATRYHSLVIDPDTLPDAFTVTAWTADNLIMGIQHQEWDCHGVQFHPESILTDHGHQLLANFLEE